MLRLYLFLFGCFVVATYGCQDTDNRCSSWKHHCNSNAHVKQNCKRTCGKCYVASAGDCVDRDGRCNSWRNLCNSNSYVKQNCYKTCNNPVCNPVITTSTCRDKDARCSGWRSHCGSHPYVKANCLKTCNKCPTAGGCADRNKNCRNWANSGECRKNPGYMNVHCKTSCRVGGCGHQKPMTTRKPYRKTTKRPHYRKTTKRPHYRRTTRRPHRKTTKKYYTEAPTTTTTTTKKPRLTQRPHPSAFLGCGINKFNNPFISFVVGGKITTREKWIWQAAIYHYDIFLCGGTLVDKQYVVTAAHCVNDYGYMKDKEGFDIVLGDWDRDDKDTMREQRFRVEKVWAHPKYYKTNYDYDHDIAVIKLSKPATLNRAVGVACLPSQYEKVSLDSKCYISGWGKFSDTSSVVKKLQEVKLPLVSNKICGGKNKDPNGRSMINENMLCAGSPKENKGSCGGDSGGPLVCQNSKKQWTLQGAVSWGSQFCDSRIMYPVFARVGNYVDWIKKQMAEG
ncbi:transmembrane protease serine 13-like [Clytia hemisphaerica]|uniref:Uncharacterized protein n=1 Tax=Clytia hemisphaerica TaxID=252671 RepID=A0A7M5XGJ6_9CNID